jgi:hypothetical protein
MTDRDEQKRPASDVRNPKDDQAGAGDIADVQPAAADQVRGGMDGLRPNAYQKK